MKGKSRAERIIEQDPNGLVVLDKTLQIVDHNQAFLKIFAIADGEEVIGRNFNQVVGQVIFACADILKDLHKIKYHKRSGHYVDPVTFTLDMDELNACFFVDITGEQIEQENHAKMKAETIRQAREVIGNQMRVVQEIAGLLGETTAESKVQLLKLIEMLKSEDEK